MAINDLQAGLKIHKKNLKFAEHVIENGLMDIPFEPIERSRKAIEKIDREIEIEKVIK